MLIDIKNTINPEIGKISPLDQYDPRSDFDKATAFIKGEVWPVDGSMYYCTANETMYVNIGGFWTGAYAPTSINH